MKKDFELFQSQFDGVYKKVKSAIHGSGSQLLISRCRWADYVLVPREKKFHA